MRTWITLALVLGGTFGCGKKDDSDLPADTDTTTANQPPEPEDDDATVFSGATVVIDVVDNDDDPNGGRLTVVSVTDPEEGGTAEVDSRTEVSYSSAPGFTGTDTFTYRVEDKEGEGAKGTVTVTVTEAPTIEITSPEDDAVLGGTTVEVQFEVVGCSMSSPSDDPSGCHLHKYVDGTRWAGNDNPGHYDDGPFELQEVEPGERDIEVRLVSNDGSDAEFSPVISDAISVTVGGTTSTPTESATPTDTAVLTDTALPTDTTSAVTDTGLDTALDGYGYVPDTGPTDTAAPTDTADTP